MGGNFTLKMKRFFMVDFKSDLNFFNFKTKVCSL